LSLHSQNLPRRRKRKRPLRLSYDKKCSRPYQSKDTRVPPQIRQERNSTSEHQCAALSLKRNQHPACGNPCATDLALRKRSKSRGLTFASPCALVAQCQQRCVAPRVASNRPDTATCLPTSLVLRCRRKVHPFLRHPPQQCRVHPLHLRNHHKLLQLSQRLNRSLLPCRCS
jgi:hypothetical protein